MALASDRDALLSKLSLFLDASTRCQLNSDDLLQLQDVKSSTDRSEWRKLRREARAHTHAQPQEQFFGQRPEEPKTSLISPKAIGRRNMILNRENNCSNVQVEHSCSTVVPSAVLLPEHSCSDTRRSITTLTPLKPRGSLTARIADKVKGLRGSREDNYSITDEANSDALHSFSTEDSSRRHHDTATSHYDSENIQHKRNSPPSARRRRKPAWRISPSPDGIVLYPAEEEPKRDSVLSSAVTIPDDNSPIPCYDFTGRDEAGQEKEGSERTVKELEHELSKACEEIVMWKERCMELQAALCNDSNAERHAHRMRSSNMDDSCPSDRKPIRRAMSDSAAARAHGGWLMRPMLGGTEELRVGEYFLSSPVQKTLHKTLEEEATDIEKVTKAMLEGEDEHIGDVGTLLQRISALKKDISVIFEMTTGGRKDELGVIGKNIAIFEEYIGSMHAEAKELVHSDQENAYVEDVKQHFDVVDIEFDGNCLFAASTVGLHALGLQEGKVSTGWRGEGAIVGWVDEEGEREKMRKGRCVSVCEATRAARKLSSEERYAMAVKLRAEVVQRVLDEPLLYGEDVATALREAVNSSRTDETSKSLRQEAARAWGKRKLNEAELLSEQAREVYAKVMSRAGIFGERLEISVVSDCVERPVHVYYYDSSHKRGQEPKPSEVFGAGRAGEPLCLLHMIQGNHFHLMRAKAVENVAVYAKGTTAPAAVLSPIKKRSPLWRYFLCV